MPITNDEVVSALNDLIETCRDGQNGFQTAAENISDPSTKRLFQGFGQQRAQFAGELQTIVREFGEDPTETGSVSGALHRGWMNLKGAISGKDEHAILEECERAEDTAVEAYEDALEKVVAADVASVIRRQYTAVQEAHNEIRSLRDRTKRATA
jgi:uncharacterized protein (TIGR02284 family)